MALSKKVIELIQEERERFEKEYPYEGAPDISNLSYIRACSRKYADRIRQELRKDDLFRAESMAKAVTKWVV